MLAVDCHGPVVNMLLYNRANGGLNRPKSIKEYHHWSTPEETTADWTTHTRPYTTPTWHFHSTPYTTLTYTSLAPKGLLLSLLRNMYDDANTMSALAHGLTDKVATVEEVAGNTKSLLLQVLQHVDSDIMIISQMTQGLIDDIKTAEDIA
ncbi:hypothetical protein DPMN_152630 [Dreissena polymorpha]|uniref:Uncharacterized protein n=2 Tax=Dreissena polymorpha TaxID=45954 RepID=A0A9D4J415_DREPO|nr:hypothetical protein DPMN_152630 [Dreissena polymorpha]